MKYLKKFLERKTCCLNNMREIIIKEIKLIEIERCNFEKNSSINSDSKREKSLRKKSYVDMIVDKDRRVPIIKLVNIN